MADLDTLIRFAEDHQFNLTGKLKHHHVVRLAKRWRPAIFFHELERFHPISLVDFISRPPQVMAQLPEQARDEFRVRVLQQGPFGPPTAFDPPVLRIGSDVINSGLTIEEALEQPAVDNGAVLTNGTSYASAKQFFGPIGTVHGASEPAPGDPRSPRWDMKVVAELKMLLETLEYELKVEQADDYPRDQDGLRGGFNIVRNLFTRIGQDSEELFPRALIVDILLQLISGHRNNNPAEVESAMARIPENWQLRRAHWEAVKRYGFLEFYFIYAYNDYDQYGDWPYENHHEGDVEGCCLVFEREALEAAAEEPNTLLSVRPVSLITSVHEARQHADRLKTLDPTLNDEQFQQELSVWVAVGSHATYLESGTHDFLDFDDLLILSDLDDFIPPLPPPPFLGPLALLLALLAAIADSFVDADDQTSDNGIVAVPESADVGESAVSLKPAVLVTPLSAPNDVTVGVNGELIPASSPIYSERQRAALRVRAFAGKWGAHDGLINHSSAFDNKTSRYFLKLVRTSPPPVVIG